MLVRCQKAYGNNTGQAPNTSFANSNYVQKIPYNLEMLQFEISSPCGGVRSQFKKIVTEENNLK